ncbi:MAG: hypothetical protein J3K34DRAFT_47626 [Monoraphidium minutum]|nr:MAG: hypothetical protein J3K34DRAFT_47626 [Monoraphidium minutum]
MTGVTQVVRCVTEQGRFGLIALLALLPAALAAAAAALLKLSPAEMDTLNNPVGPMPMPKFEFFNEQGQGGPSPTAAARWGPRRGGRRQGAAGLKRPTGAKVAWAQIASAWRG